MLKSRGMIIIQEIKNDNNSRNQIELLVTIMTPFTIASIFMLYVLNCSNFAISLCVATYHAIILLLFNIKFLSSKHFDMYQFATIISIFQILPDMFLARVLNIIVFPNDHSSVFIKNIIPIHMCGMWAIPFMIGLILDSGWLISIIIMVSEALSTFLKLWNAINVTTIFGGVALYLLPAELLLGPLILAGYKYCQQNELKLTSTKNFLLMNRLHRIFAHNLMTKVTVGMCITLTYTGTLAVRYLLYEKI